MLHLKASLHKTAKRVCGELCGRITVSWIQQNGNSTWNLAGDSGS